MKIFDQARDLVNKLRSNGDGEKLADDEEAVAIQLVEHFLPEVEIFTRRCFKKIFTDRIDNFIATTKHLI